RRFVEDENAWVGNERAGNRDALALAAREGRAAFADDRVVAFGQLEDEFVRSRQLCRRDDALHRHGGGDGGDILAHPTVENSTFSCRPTPIWRRSHAGSATARSMPSTSTRPLSGT